MANGNIPVLMELGFGYGDVWQGDGGTASLDAGPDASELRVSGPAAPAWFAVVDRKNPTAKPVFTATATNNTTVPAGIEQYMNQAHILFVVSAALGAMSPQGALLDFLMANGGGAKLQRNATLATLYGTGNFIGLIYMMASVPGSSVPGIEETPARPPIIGESTTSFVAYFQLPIELVPEAGGLYTPVELG